MLSIQILTQSLCVAVALAAQSKELLHVLLPAPVRYLVPGTGIFTHHSHSLGWDRLEYGKLTDK